ncbi:sugar transferase [Oenococcus sicerae]|uniref:Sugar transferase n=1 Tax=Oenococcus sicerae TaxID=2203724 RepID=A0AAJ1RAG2_9LACO|nr:sugar transferase [Oenococcus sicerae]MDN6899968.1 sugar transferase [Oenococcus sicerae]QAS69584.1 sugar transferase [Oenococcus sicerae]
MSESQKHYIPFKRLIDIAGSLVGFVLLSWLFLILIILQKYHDPKGPIFYHHDRVGKNHKHFKLVKFRSMRSDADSYFERHPEDYKIFVDNDYKFPAGEDPRVTRFGRLLRRTSLDELPQLFNILLGQMSIVGPRPVTEPELKYYGKNVDKFLSVLPGAMGLWQATGRSDIKYPERAVVDLEYVDHIGFWYDWYIVYLTMKAIFSREGAY